ncbi:hypothetical protein MRB53_014859 [Persea americana]|uniref:Uncharacterized protein n=1 Tax=Persea americana TaxID=3435 RepID=A0ACC2KCM2_PERAE|nr:hypothetical protein MRB53_014859 [Persea americana]
MLNWKDEQLENLGKEQEKLQLELNRLRKLKEFKPTLSSSFIQEEVKNKACLQKKKSSSAYMLWRKDQWNQVKKENPYAQLKDICNILRMKWKNLSAKEKKPYEEKHLAEKEFCLQIIRKESEKKRVLIKEEQRQKAAMELLEQYLLFRKEIDKESKRTRTERDPSKPKQPLSAFFLFLNESRLALLAEKKNAFEIAKIAGEDWRNMNEEKQVPYKEIANKLKDEYLQQMELYKRKKDEVILCTK